MSSWPIDYNEVLAAHDRIAPHLQATPLRQYPLLDEAIGHGIEVFVKHENHQPTGSFKIRNGLSAATALSSDERERGLIAASRGNHGQGVAFAGKLLGVPTTICVPLGNSPLKNRAMRKLGARLIEEGADYDASVAVAQRLVQDEGLTMVHSTNSAPVIAGAATITLELLRQASHLDALIVAVGGGSQAVGALTVVRKLRPEMPVYGVQAAAASAIHDSYHAGERLTRESAHTFADGLATRGTYDMTFAPLCEGLADFVVVSEAELRRAVALYIEGTSNLAEGAGAAGLAGLVKLAPRLAGKRVGVILSGGNIDREVLQDCLAEPGTSAP